MFDDKPIVILGLPPEHALRPPRHFDTLPLYIADHVPEYITDIEPSEDRMSDEVYFKNRLKDAITDTAPLHPPGYFDVMSDPSWQAAPEPPPKIGGKKANKSKRKAQKKARRHQR